MTSQKNLDAARQAQRKELALVQAELERVADDIRKLRWRLGRASPARFDDVITELMTTLSDVETARAGLSYLESLSADDDDGAWPFTDVPDDDTGVSS